MKPGFDYAGTARMCAEDMLDRGQCLAMLAILCLVKFEPWFGRVNPLRVDAEHLVLILCLGADIYESERRKPHVKGTK